MRSWAGTTATGPKARSRSTARGCRVSRPGRPSVHPGDHEGEAGPRSELGVPDAGRPRAGEDRAPAGDEQRVLALRACRGAEQPPSPPDLHLVRPGEGLHAVEQDRALRLEV